MVLFKIDADGIAVDEAECDAPWAVHMDGVADRIKSSQAMRIKAGNVHILGAHRDIQRLQTAQDAGM